MWRSFPVYFLRQKGPTEEQPYIGKTVDIKKMGASWLNSGTQWKSHNTSAVEMSPSPIHWYLKIPFRCKFQSHDCRSPWSVVGHGSDWAYSFCCTHSLSIRQKFSRFDRCSLRVLKWSHAHLHLTNGIVQLRTGRRPGNFFYLVDDLLEVYQRWECVLHVWNSKYSSRIEIVWKQTTLWQKKSKIR